MRMYALAIVAAAALCSPGPAFSQGIEIGPGGVHIDRGRDREGPPYVVHAEVKLSS